MRITLAMVVEKYIIHAIKMII